MNEGTKGFKFFLLYSHDEELGWLKIEMNELSVSCFRLEFPVF